MNTDYTKDLKEWAECWKLIQSLRREIKALRSLLREQVYYADPETYKNTGYTLEAGRNTEIRDIEYREAAMFPTPDECVQAALEEELKSLTPKEQPNRPTNEPSL